jgi:hypothetical protein
MTTMFDRFYGVPQDPVRLGRLKELSGFGSKSPRIAWRELAAA